MKRNEGAATAGLAEITYAKSRSIRANREAQSLLWVLKHEDANKHINCNLERTLETPESEAHRYWLEVKSVFDAIAGRKIDKVEDFIHLLNFVNSLEPQEKWIGPLLKDVPFQDLQSQLLTVVEDYKDYKDLKEEE